VPHKHAVVDVFVGLIYLVDVIAVMGLVGVYKDAEIYEKQEAVP
jgi:hypothetical protein